MKCDKCGAISKKYDYLTGWQINSKIICASCLSDKNDFDNAVDEGKEEDKNYNNCKEMLSIILRTEGEIKPIFKAILEDDPSFHQPQFVGFYINPNTGLMLLGVAWHCNEDEKTFYFTMTDNNTFYEGTLKDVNFKKVFYREREFKTIKKWTQKLEDLYVKQLSLRKEREIFDNKMIIEISEIGKKVLMENI